MSTPRRELRLVGSIHSLDAVTVGQIAAGEIIERPASVVKELVENAIDAGANRITVSIVRGGLDRIDVIDDGAGIAADDLSVALRRHTTSKLRTAQDLETIATLGFRGEGLASIAAVARTEILSRPTTSDIGARVYGYAEEVSDVERVPAPIGTAVTVTALFDNVPVRREYLRSPQAEFNRISAWLSSFAVAYPNRMFTLRHDGKDVWIMPTSGNDRDRLGMVFGRRESERLLTLDGDAARTLEGRLRGFVSPPGEDRADRRMQLLFINGRLVRNGLLAGAWTSGYATFTMTGRHPYGAIFLDLPPEQVDPNVHPTKSEVRLRYGNQIFDAVRRAIVATLTNHAGTRLRDHLVAPLGDVSFAPAATPLFEASNLEDEDAVSDRLRVLAQVDRTYILATEGSAVLLVDQHAAHERVAYEAIVARACGHGSSEPLLVPQLVELDSGRSDVLDRTMETLREGGLEIESFGERAYRIVATPFGYGAHAFDLGGFIDDLTDEPKQRDVRERVWASLACHSVTVAGEHLEVASMTTLLQRLQRCENPMHCPHGRPTMIRLGSNEIARMFKRV